MFNKVVITHTETCLDWGELMCSNGSRVQRRMWCGGHGGYSKRQILLFPAWERTREGWESVLFAGRGYTNTAGREGDGRVPAVYILVKFITWRVSSASAAFHSWHADLWNDLRGLARHAHSVKYRSVEAEGAAHQLPAWSDYFKH